MKNRPVVALIVSSLVPGGAESQAVLMARAIKNHSQYEPYIFGLASGGPLEEVLKAENIRYKTLNIDLNRFHDNWIRKIAVIIKVAFHFIRYNVKVVLPFTLYPNIIGNAAAYLIFKKHFWHQVGKEWDTPVSALQKFVLTHTKSFLSNSEAAKSYLIERLRVPAGKIRVIPNIYYLRPVIHSPEYWKQKLNIREKDIVILLLGNFFPVKDHITAVKAMRILSAKYENLKMIFSGYAPEPANKLQLIEAAYEYNLSGKLIFSHSTPDVPGIMSVAHIGLFTSVNRHTEGSPNVLMDYMYAGLPVVASDIDCNKEIFYGKQAELLYEPENENSLAEKLSVLIENEGKRRELGEINKREAAELYHPDRLIEHMKYIIS